MSIKGTIKIRKGNENQEPTVVYVSHMNNFNYWVCEVINTSGTVFTSNERDLIDFNYKLFMQMYYDWKIKNQKVVTARFRNIRKEWD